MQSNSRKSFTLIEILAVLGIAIVIFALTAVFYRSHQIQAQIESHTAEMIQTLRKAQYSTILGKNNEQYGIHFESNKYILFANTYDPLDENDEEYDLPTTIRITNITIAGNEIKFRKPYGIPDKTGGLEIHTDSGLAKKITINEAGTVQWEPL